MVILSDSDRDVTAQPRIQTPANHALDSGPAGHPASR